jgi:MYXO-CTERM domain-containing protein
MRLFGVSIDTSTPWPWLAALALLAIGAFLARRSFAKVKDAWQQATEEAASGSAGRPAR